MYVYMLAYALFSQSTLSMSTCQQHCFEAPANFEFNHFARNADNTGIAMINHPLITINR